MSFLPPDLVTAFRIAHNGRGLPYWCAKAMGATLTQDDARRTLHTALHGALLCTAAAALKQTNGQTDIGQVADAMAEKLPRLQHHIALPLARNCVEAMQDMMALTEKTINLDGGILTYHADKKAWTVSPAPDCVERFADVTITAAPQIHQHPFYCSDPLLADIQAVLMPNSSRLCPVGQAAGFESELRYLIDGAVCSAFGKISARQAATLPDAPNGAMFKALEAIIIPSLSLTRFNPAEKGVLAGRIMGEMRSVVSDGKTAITIEPNRALAYTPQQKQWQLRAMP